MARGDRGVGEVDNLLPLLVVLEGIAASSATNGSRGCYPRSMRCYYRLLKVLHWAKVLLPSVVEVLQTTDGDDANGAPCSY
jgi:hypothetical protein